MPGSCVSVLGASCVLTSACTTAELDCREPRKCELDCAYSCAHHNCVTDITCACLCCTCFFQVQEVFSLFALFVWSSVNSLNSPLRICFGCESHHSTYSGSQLTALKHTGGIRCNVTPIMYTHRMLGLKICSSVLHSQPVFHLLLEALQRGLELDHLEISVAWMFSLQRTSIHCSSLTKYTDIL